MIRGSKSIYALYANMQQHDVVQPKWVQTVKLFSIVIHLHLVNYECLLETNGPLSGTWLILKDKWITWHKFTQVEWVNIFFISWIRENMNIMSKNKFHPWQALRMTYLHTKNGCLNYTMLFVHSIQWFNMSQNAFQTHILWSRQNAFHDILNHKMDYAEKN